MRVGINEVAASGQFLACAGSAALKLTDMKATITLEDALLRQAIARAAERGMTFDALFAYALRLALSMTPAVVDSPKQHHLRLVPTLPELSRLFDDLEVERLLQRQ